MSKSTYEWGKATIFCCCVLAAALGVGISNYYVFYDSFWMATILLAITVGVAAVAAYYSGDATPKVRHYCIIFHLIIGAVLCVNLASHFVLARQISAAKTGVIDRHEEENRQETFRQLEAQRQSKLIAEQVALAEAERKRSRAEAARFEAMRRMGYRGGYTGPVSIPAPAPTVEQVKAPALPESLTSREEKPAPSKTPEQLQKEWNPWLTFWAFAEVFISVLGGLILAGRWEWDRNHDGIADHLQKPNEFPHEVDAGK